MQAFDGKINENFTRLPDDNVNLWKQVYYSGFFVFVYVFLLHRRRRDRKSGEESNAYSLSRNQFLKKYNGKPFYSNCIHNLLFHTSTLSSLVGYKKKILRSCIHDVPFGFYLYNETCLYSSGKLEFERKNWYYKRFYAWNVWG